ncbi:unnamed protein product, partial [Hymenolepis diminuta]
SRIFVRLNFGPTIDCEFGERSRSDPFCGKFSWLSEDLRRASPMHLQYRFLQIAKSRTKSTGIHRTANSRRYVSFPSRVTFWVTELIITGYPNALQLGHLWAVDSKNLAAHVVPVFLRIIYKHLHVDISGELDASHTANSHFPAAVSNTSHDQKSGIADANLNTSIVQLRMRLVPVEAYSQNSVYLLRVLQAAKKSSRSDREICRERRILAKTYRGVYIYS